jgi:hypothetical protein
MRKMLGCLYPSVFLCLIFIILSRLQAGTWVPLISGRDPRAYGDNPPFDALKLLAAASVSWSFISRDAVLRLGDYNNVPVGLPLVLSLVTWSDAEVRRPTFFLIAITHYIF